MSRPRATNSPVDELGAVLADLKARVTKVEQQSHRHPDPTALLPVGTLLPFGGAAAPTGFLLANGTTVSRATYADLFAVYGITFGAGDGLTTFGLPDLRGRVVAGLDNMGTSAASRLTSSTMTPNGTTLGGSGGAEQETHLHMTFVGADGSATYIMDSTDPLVPVTDVVTGFRWADVPTYGRAYAGIRRSSTTNTTTNNTQPTLLLNWLIKT